MYESPIEIICNEIVKQQENDVYQAVQQYGITVDKEELLKALRYDREQYTRGYNDALDEVKECLIEKFREKQQKYLDLYDEYMDGEDYRSSLLIEEMIDIVKEMYEKRHFMR